MNKLVKLILGLAFVACIFIAALPSLVSSGWGRNQIVRIVNSTIPGEITIEHLRLSWFGKNGFEGMKLKTASGDEVVAIDDFSTRTSLWGILQRSPDLKQASISGLNLNLFKAATGQSNLDLALGFRAIPMDLPSGIPLTLQNVQVNIQNIGDETQFMVKGETQRGDLTGQFNINAEIKGLESSGIRSDAIVKLKANVKNFPVELIDAVIGMRYPMMTGLSQSLIGETLNLKIDQTFTHEEILFLLNLKAGNLTSNFQTKISDGVFSLETPGTINWQIPLPNEWNNKRGLASEFSIDQLEFPLSFFTDESSSIPSIQARYTIQSAQKFATPIGVVTIQQMHASIDGAEKSPQMNFNLETNLMIDNRPVSASLNGSIDKERSVSRFGTGISAQLVLKNIPTTLLDHFVSSENTFVNILGESATVTMNLRSEKDLFLSFQSDKIKIPEFKCSFGRDYLSGKVKINEIHVEHPLESTLIENVYIPWKYQNGKLSGTYEGATSRDQIDLKGNFAGEFSIGQDSYDTLQSHLSLRAKDIPIQLFDHIVETNELDSLLGDFLDVNLVSDLVFSDKIKGEMDLGFRGTDLEGHFSLLIDDKIQLNPKALDPEFNLTITPERFQSIRKILKGDSKKPERIKLLEPFQLKAKITSFNFPTWNENELFPYWETGLNADLKINNLRVSDMQRDQKMEFQDVSTTINSSKLSQNIAFHIHGTQAHKYNDDSELTIQGELNNGFLPNGVFNHDQFALQLNSQATNLPAALFCRLIIPDPTLGDKLEALLGERIRSEIKIDINQLHGPIFVSLHGPNGSLQFDAQVNNGVMTLNKPFTAEVTATPLLGREVLKGLVPFLNELIRADSPLTFQISTDKFSFPLRDFDTRRIEIGQASIQLGKMHFRNEGDLQSILGLLNAQETEEVPIWFTPLYWNVSNGVIGIWRMDMLVADKYPIATWGKIDLVKDKVNMVIGISGTSLNQALGNSNIPQDYFLQVPLKGTLAKAKIDKNQTASRIGAILAKSKGGTEGLVFGTLLDLANGKEGKVPKPTTDPLPWQPEKTNEESQKQQTTDPIKKFEKEAKSVFKNIFK